MPLNCTLKSCFFDQIKSIMEREATLEDNSDIKVTVARKNHHEQL